MLSNRRDFLRNSALLGVAAISPVGAVLGKDFSGKPPKPVATVPSPVDTYTVSTAHIGHSPVSPRQIVIPDVEGFKVLKGDFHMHTLFSDGSVMPKDRVAEAVTNGLDVISITDHIEYRPFFSKVGRWKLADDQANNFNLWYEVALPEAEKRNLLLVRGAEITKTTMPPGHFNALFADDNNPIAAAVDDWREMLRIAADHGAFLFWNHPGWEAPKSGGIEKGAPLRFTAIHEEIYKKGWMHGIEIFNGKQYYPVVSDWCNERELALFANSDIHPSEFDQYGVQNPLRPITLVLAKERSVESVREAFFAKRTIAWAANIVWGSRTWLTALFKASVGIKTITPGTLELTNTSSLPVVVSMGGATVELPKEKHCQVFCSNSVRNITVTNWIVGMNKPLEVPLNT
ncbi:MAG: PHP domain-containing protein [Bacteroidales bacterium]|jgi:predicted metal-dependent phosphoesterase TrpH|nr:PHP domain-containing protein [Bacteroidales bacterium]